MVPNLLQTPNTAGNNDQLDPQVVNLAKAIREIETRGQKDPYTARGASGEFGAYQYTPGTWAKDSKTFLGRDVPLEQADRFTQNEVAYKKLKYLKDQGYNPGQIASIWNSGKPQWEGNVGVNKHGVKYDTPKYVDAVTKAYQALKAGEQPVYQDTSSTVGKAEYGVPDEVVAEQNFAQLMPLGMRMGTKHAPTPQDAKDALIGGVKGLVDTLDGANVLKTMHKMAGDTHDWTGQSFEDQEKAMMATNNAQLSGKIQEQIGEALIPAGMGNAVVKAWRASKIPGQALDIVAPKATRKTIEQAYKTGRVQVSGLMKNVSMTPDQRTMRAANVMEDLIRQGKVKPKGLAADNANAVYDEIGVEAENLVAKLKAQEIKLILQPEELTQITQRAMQEIGENPTMVGNAAETANRIFNKFQSFLPKGRDITAEDLLDARKKLDMWVRSVKGDKVFDPSTENAMSIALRAMRQEINDLVAEKAPDVAVKNSLARQSSLYDALDNIAAKGVSEMGSSAKTRYFQRHPYQKEALRTGVAGLIQAPFFGAFMADKVVD